MSALRPTAIDGELAHKLYVRLGMALVALRTIRPCVEVYRDRYDFTVGTAMLADLDAEISRMETYWREGT